MNRHETDFRPHVCLFNDSCDLLQPPWPFLHGASVSCLYKLVAMQSNPLLHFNESFKTLPTAGTANNDNAFLNTLSSRQILTYATAFLIGYPILVSLFRFRRRQSLQERYNFPTRESLARMTDDQAWEIQKELAQLEFPFIYVKSLQFALFRVRT